MTQPRIDTEALKWDRPRPPRSATTLGKVNNSHMFEWVRACAGDAKTYSPFQIGARITEIGMLERSGAANAEANPLGRQKPSGSRTARSRCDHRSETVHECVFAEGSVARSKPHGASRACLRLCFSDIYPQLSLCGSLIQQPASRGSIVLLHSPAANAATQEMTNCVRRGRGENVQSARSGCGGSSFC